MSRGKKPRTTQRLNWIVRVDKRIAQTTDLLLLDPTKARVRYGLRTELINQLLAEWIEDVKAGRRKVPNPTRDVSLTPGN